MFLEGIQNDNLNKVLCHTGNKLTTGVDPEKDLSIVYDSKYRIKIDHQIVTGHGVFYPRPLYHDLIFKLTLAPASIVVKGSDATKPVYKLKNIQLEYEMIRSKYLAAGATSVLSSGKEFAFYDIQRFTLRQFDLKDDTVITFRMNS